jgi:hypothetical protein
MPEEPNYIATVLATLIDLQKQLEAQDKKIDIMNEKLEASLAMSGIPTVAPVTMIPTCRPLDMIPTCKNNKWVEYTKSILVSRFNTDENDAQAVYDVLLQLAKQQIKSLQPQHYKPGEPKSWKSVRTFVQDQLISNLENEAATFDVYPQHCENHWLSRRLLSRVHIDSFRPKKSKKRKITTITTISNS